MRGIYFDYLHDIVCHLVPLELLPTGRGGIRRALLDIQVPRESLVADVMGRGMIEVLRRHGVIRIDRPVPIFPSRLWLLGSQVEICFICMTEPVARGPEAVCEVAD